MGTEKGLEPLIDLVNGDDIEIVSATIYALGSLAENDDVKAKLVELSAVEAVIKQMLVGDIEVKRASGYFVATLCQQVEFHDDLARAGVLEAVISLSVMEDIECQEYAAFSLAHLSSNREYQVPLVQAGAVKPLVAMLASEAEPRHYAGLALLKLADNFENHLRIAEEGGIQALLRLGRTRSSDEQVQYKAAITVGQLASNAVKMIPNAKERDGGQGLPTEGSIGHGARMLTKIRTQNDVQKGREGTLAYLDKTTGSGLAGRDRANKLTKTALEISTGERDENAM